MLRSVVNTCALPLGTGLLAAASMLSSMLQAQQAAASLSGGTGLAARAEQALQAHDFSAAMQVYRTMLQADPKNSEAWTGLGVLLYGSGKAAEAKEALAKALALNPTAPRAQLFLAFCEADLRQCDQALPVLERNFASEPVGKLQRLVGLTLLGCTSGVGQEMLAVRTVTQLKQTYPSDADVLYQSAELYTRFWSESANELITSHPDSYRVHQLAGEVNEAQGNGTQAIRQYRAALAENPKLPQMHYRIGQLLLKEGAPDADAMAMEEFTQELTIDPLSGTSALAMGEIHRHQGQLERAATEYRLAEKLEPGLIEAQIGLGQTLLAQHEATAAQSVLRELLNVHPENAQAHYAMMLTYRAQGKLPEASAEMATFERLQQGGAEQFRDKLNALLSGTSTGLRDHAAGRSSAPDSSTGEPNR